MKLYKPSFKTKAGQTQATPKWYLDFRDHLRRRQRLAGFESADDTERLARLVGELVRARRLGQTPEIKWLGDLERLPADIQARLLKIDIVKPVWLSGYRNNLLDQWVADFEAYLRETTTRKNHRRNTVYVNATLSRLRAIVSGCHFKQWLDVTPGQVERFVSGLHVSTATVNAYLQAIKLFARWLRREGLIERNPLADLQRKVVPLREVRRPLEVNEVRPLLAAAVNGVRRFSVEPMDRAVLYLVALVTGFRRNELSHLTPESFDLARAEVRLPAHACKDRLPACNPLPVWLLEGLRAFLAGKPAGVRLWHPLTQNTSAMLRVDATAAGLATVDSQGRVLCLHSLRHSLRSWLVKARVHEAVIDAILRHKPSKADVGRAYYTHIGPDDLRHAIESLPSLPWPGDLVGTKPDIRCPENALL